MVVLKLQGGLGNQLFQYAAYLTLRTRFSDCYLEVSDYNLPYDNKFRSFNLKYFNIIDLKLCIFNDSKKKQLKYKFLYPHIKVFSKAIQTKMKYVYVDDGFNYTSDLCEITENCYIEGWFCYDKFLSTFFRRFTYFNVREIFLNDKIYELFCMINSCNSCSVHIRRTDYLKITQYTDICTENYYKRAIEYIEDHVQNSVFYFFSDDIEWTINMFGQKNNYIYLAQGTINYNNPDIEDLFLMSSCKNNIIANSTYSWWGAMLNKNEKKIVVRPQKWLNNNDKYDICPSDWIKGEI